MRKILRLWVAGLILLMFVVTFIGGSYYMLFYSLAPNAERADTASCFRRLYEKYPETQPWVDSLRRVGGLRDTFVTMPTGERHHALFVRRDGNRRTALVLHGWRGSSIDILFLARIYEQEMGYNIVVPDFHAHGLSDGDMIQMGWLDRLDMREWLKIFQTDSMVVHGVSMGGATAMMMSGMGYPEDIKDIRFVDDCGYTSVWDEFAGELKNQFGLPEVPLMYITSLLCKLHNGWSFGDASAIRAVRRTNHPILFIHGDEDTFVPTEMVYRLYKVCPSKEKSLWITKGAKHAESYKLYKEEYVRRVREFNS